MAFDSMDLRRYLAAMSYELDKTLIKKGYDPNKLRHEFYSNCEADSKVVHKYSYEEPHPIDDYYGRHYLDGCFSDDFPYYGPEVSFTTGTTFMYWVDYKLYTINYDPSVKIGVLNGKDVYGAFYYDTQEVEINDWAEDGSYCWTYPASSNGGRLDMVWLYNTHPYIVGELCNHVGPLVINNYIRVYE